MRIERVENDKIFVEIPLTTQSGKTRVKVRNSFYEYGLPTATRQIPFTQKHYIEWQIGYDIDKNDREKLALSTLQDSGFIGANGKNKALYELSEFIYYFMQFGIIKKDEIAYLIDFLSKVKSNELIDSQFSILRTHPIEREILGINFYHSQVQYPLLVHKFGVFDILVEIIIKEKQRAIGVQPMLYVCFPITELRPQNNIPLLGRVAEQKECASLILDANHKNFLLESFRIFGILSPSHNHDIRQILERMIGDNL
ncbi:restriction endonuclease [Helicobacter monodelphidis]|uniref:R.Pab1 family restriction endonuclease n=1 Tax=Helicobacter sp. 15-1451 TaxID=2004995 RepID=UPI000DCE33C5|nr:R.Pab1 family restriction endonuclease [Helicobacter sp. 15-1451]RAX57318.1 restriction endonuclease [Helicobacter sp. 15-1451]